MDTTTPPASTSMPPHATSEPTFFLSSNPSNREAA
jgi:hypothetical protein